MNTKKKKFILNDIKKMLYEFRYNHSTVTGSEILEKAGVNKNKHSIKGNLLRK